MPFANAVTGCIGNRLFMGMDLQNMQPAEPCDQKDCVWDLVRIQANKKCELAQLLYSDRMSMLADYVIRQGTDRHKTCLYNDKYRVANVRDIKIENIGTYRQVGSRIYFKKCALVKK